MPLNNESINQRNKPNDSLPLPERPRVLGPIRNMEHQRLLESTSQAGSLWAWSHQSVPPRRAFRLRCQSLTRIKNEKQPDRYGNRLPHNDRHTSPY